MHNVTKKDQPFCWTKPCQKAFDELKRSLTTAPVLTLPNDVDTFVLDTDASGECIGAVLSQIQNGQEKPIAYASRKLSNGEMNYCTTRRELLAVVHFLKYYRHYLLGRRFVVRTDHSTLQWLRRLSDPVGQQARWFGYIEEFDCSIVHRPGARHLNADALSRRPCRNKICRRKSDVLQGGRDACMMTDARVDRLTTENAGSATAVGDNISTVRANDKTESAVVFVPSADGQRNVANLRSTDDRPAGNDCAVVSCAVGAAPETDRVYRRTRWRETGRRIDRIPFVHTECVGCPSFSMGDAIKPIKHGERVISLKNDNETVGHGVANCAVSLNRYPEVKGSSLANVGPSFQQYIDNDEPRQRFVGSLDACSGEVEVHVAVRIVSPSLPMCSVDGKSGFPINHTEGGVDRMSGGAAQGVLVAIIPATRPRESCPGPLMT